MLVIVAVMDNSKKPRVFSELASDCKKEKRKWELAEFEEMFVTPVVRRRAVTLVAESCLWPPNYLYVASQKYA